MTGPTPSAEPPNGSSWTTLHRRVGGRLSAKMRAHPRLARWLLAGPVTLLVTLAIMSGMTAWWPPGAAGVDQIAMPLILFPAIWVCVFVYALLEDRFGRAGLVMSALILGNGVLITMG